MTNNQTPLQKLSLTRRDSRSVFPRLLDNDVLRVQNDCADSWRCERAFSIQPHLENCFGLLSLVSFHLPCMLCEFVTLSDSQQKDNNLGSIFNWFSVDPRLGTLFLGVHLEESDGLLMAQYLFYLQKVRIATELCGWEIPVKRSSRKNTTFITMLPLSNIKTLSNFINHVKQKWPKLPIQTYFVFSSCLMKQKDVKIDIFFCSRMFYF